MLELPDVTVCAIDCVTPELAAAALDRSMRQCNFGETLLLSDRRVDSRAVWTRISRLDSIEAYNDFMLRELLHHVSTSHVLVIQWDGFVVDPGAWQPQFLNYDYIGARWPWHPPGLDMGNGGFSLRSRRLLQATASAGFQRSGAPEDDLICRINRPYLEQAYGIRFAPADVADRFAYERGDPQRPTFGFHGPFNLWRHLSDEEVTGMLNTLSPRTCLSVEFIELQVTYVQQRKWRMFARMYQRMAQAGNRETVMAAYARVLREPGAPQALVSLGEELAASR
mgnify:CR=1 FL=1